MKIEMKSNVGELANGLNISARQLPFAISLGLNRTAQAVKAGLREEMQRVFDRPTPWVLNSLQLTPSSKRDLVAQVWFKPLAEKYMLPHVEGGGRRQKRSEQWLGSYWTPGAHLGGGPNVGNLLDRHGNVRGSMITEILSYTGTHPDQYSRTSANSLKRNKRWRKGLVYFIEWKDGKPVGVFRRIGKGDARTVLKFIGAPKYRPRLDFTGVAHRIVDKEAPKQFAAAVDQALKTAYRR